MSRYATGQRGAPDDSLTQQSPRSCRSRSFWGKGRGRIPRRAAWRHATRPQRSISWRLLAVLPWNVHLWSCLWPPHRNSWRFCQAVRSCGRCLSHRATRLGADPAPCQKMRPCDSASLFCAKGSDPCDTMRQKRPGRFCLIDVAANPSTIGWLVEASIRCASRLLAATVWLSMPPLELEE